jgi:hypothetical protein
MGLRLAQHWEFWVYSIRPWDEIAGAALEEARLGLLLDDKDSMAHAILSLMLERRGSMRLPLRKAEPQST